MSRVAVGPVGDAWTSVYAARMRLGIGAKAMDRLVRSGRLTIRHVPEGRLQLLIAEVEALARASIIPRAAEAAPCN